MTRNWTDSSARAPEAYTGDEIEMFRDVFYTMQETDVAGWGAESAITRYQSAR